MRRPIFTVHVDCVCAECPQITTPTDGFNRCNPCSVPVSTAIPGFRRQPKPPKSKRGTFPCPFLFVHAQAPKEYTNSFPFIHSLRSFIRLTQCLTLVHASRSFHSLTSFSSLRLLVHIVHAVSSLVTRCFTRSSSVIPSVHSTHSSLLLVHSIHDSSFISFVPRGFDA